MAFEVPQRAIDFFALRTSALPIFSDEDGILYLNGYQNKALLDAKRNVKALYKIDNSLVITEIYNPNPAPPVSYTYSLGYDASVDGAVVSFKCDTFIEAVTGQSGPEFENAIISVITAAGFAFTSIVIDETSPEVFDIQVVSEDDFILILINGVPTEFPFAQVVNP